MPDLFLSYASEDRHRVQPLAQALEEEGWTVWWDRVIPPGRTFDDVIEEKLAEARCVVVVWTESSGPSRWVRTEASEGLARGLLVPVMLDEVDLPLAFRRIQAADLSNWQPGEHSTEFNELLAAIDRHAPRGESAGQAPPKSPVGTLPARESWFDRMRVGVREFTQRHTAWVAAAVAVVLIGGGALILNSGGGGGGDPETATTTTTTEATTTTTEATTATTEATTPTTEATTPTVPINSGPSGCDDLHAGRVFCDGFEVEFSEVWDDPARQTGGTVTRVADPVYRGDGALQAEATRGGAFVYVHTNALAGTTGELWVRFYAYVPSGQEIVRFNFLYVGEGNPPWGGLEYGLQNEGRIFARGNPAGVLIETAEPAMPFDTWTCLETHLLMDENVGAIEHYRDGELLGSATGIDTFPDSGIGDMNIGFGLTDGEQPPITIYIDEVVGDVDRIGCDA